MMDILIALLLRPVLSYDWFSDVNKAKALGGEAKPKASGCKAEAKDLSFKAKAEA